MVIFGLFAKPLVKQIREKDRISDWILKCQKTQERQLVSKLNIYIVCLLQLYTILEFFCAKNDSRDWGISFEPAELQTVSEHFPMHKDLSQLSSLHQKNPSYRKF